MMLMLLLLLLLMMLALLLCFPPALFHFLDCVSWRSVLVDEAVVGSGLLKRLLMR
jgi:hypothetical protein